MFVLGIQLYAIRVPETMYFHIFSRFPSFHEYYALNLTDRKMNVPCTDRDDRVWGDFSHMLSTHNYILCRLHYKFRFF